MQQGGPERGCSPLGKVDGWILNFGFLLWAQALLLLPLVPPTPFRRTSPRVLLPPPLVQTVEGNVSVIFSAEEMEEVLAKNPDKLVVLFCGLTWCRCG